MKKTKILFVVVWLLLVAVFLLSGQPMAYAVETGGIGVMPAATKDYPANRSWFVYEAEAKTVIKDRVNVINRGNKSVNLIVAALDGAVSQNGGYTLIGSMADNKDIGTWVELEKTEVTLPPKSNQILNFTVTVPDNADVGSHPGGIVVLEKPAEASTLGAKKKNSSQLTVVTRIAARMYLTVPGEIQRRLEVKQIRHSIGNGLLYFFLRLKNNGNVQLNAIADVTLRGLFGKVGSQSGAEIGMLLRGSEITAQLPWQKNPPAFGRFVADFRLHYGEKDFKGEYVKDEYIDVRYVFWIIQWIKILWFIGGIILLLLIRNLWLWLLIQSRLNTRTKKHKVKKGETLMSVAQLYGVHPKKLAKFNLLRWPYELNVDDVLLIPQGQMSRGERLTMGDDWNAYYKAEQRKVWLTDLKFVGALLGKIRFRRRNMGVVSTARHSGKVRLIGPHPESQDSGVASLPRMTKGGVPTVAMEALVAEKGDTIYDISEFAGISIQEIVRLNNLRPPYRLRAGQEILVPIAHKTTVKPKRVTKKAAPSTKSVAKPKSNKKKRSK
ncbi:hypothetical protein A2994_03015 [candidate division Kazan bacterium RIFCSPLOWO2_01_FULL_48_13]|uniref:LysM domain-containing protein n=1 Tax=candidate division Kazan bacterium RIFCSPLOWO2_01_FULL_48_13 TaxID=1798539 RepID=A0A1F4PQ44_UNCK3|nr:MAG: hypothetical protein A2994_03015 [candidate division Kazan bacterium RIFCSPLOWO2_01_FULL_48_13]